MDFRALERLFYQRHPQGSFELGSIRRVPSVTVQFKPGGLAYTYKGSAQSIAEEMKLIGVERDLDGKAVLPEPVEGKYICHVNVSLDPRRVWVLTVTSPFTGTTLSIKEGYKDRLPSGLWDSLEAQVQQSGRKAGLHAGADCGLTLEELKAVKAAHEQQQAAIASIGKPS